MTTQGNIRVRKRDQATTLAQFDHLFDADCQFQIRVLPVQTVIELARALGNRWL